MVARLQLILESVHRGHIIRVSRIDHGANLGNVLASTELLRRERMLPCVVQPRRDASVLIDHFHRLVAVTGIGNGDDRVLAGVNHNCDIDRVPVHTDDRLSVEWRGQAVVEPSTDPSGQDLDLEIGEQVVDPTRVKWSTLTGTELISVLSPKWRASPSPLCWSLRHSHPGGPVAPPSAG